MSKQTEIEQLKEIIGKAMVRVYDTGKVSTEHWNKVEEQSAKAAQALIDTACVEAVKDYKMRHKLPLNKTDLAEYLGISRPTLNLWIDNPGKMTLEAVRKIAELETNLTNQEKSIDNDKSM